MLCCALSRDREFICWKKKKKVTILPKHKRDNEIKYENGINLKGVQRRLFTDWFLNQSRCIPGKRKEFVMITICFHVLRNCKEHALHPVGYFRVVVVSILKAILCVTLAVSRLCQVLTSLPPSEVERWGRLLMNNWFNHSFVRSFVRLFIREIKHHVYGKHQTAEMTMCLLFPATFHVCRLQRKEVGFHVHDKRELKLNFFYRSYALI